VKQYIQRILTTTMLFMAVMMSVTSLAAQTRIGVIKGQVVDQATQSPLVGVNVIVIGTQLGASTDVEGNFSVIQVPVGNYSVQFSYLGYETSTRTDVIVRSQRITFVHADLPATTFQGDDVTITAGYFTENDERRVSVTTFSSEEIRRSPGSAGDVSRIISVLPSVAKVNDQTNGLIVRGGSQVENGFYLDNIEIPNINHYPTQGATGGPIGLLNVDFIDDVNFSAGGFSPAYGNRLSSVMELSFREGNRDELDGQLDLHFAGMGIAAEGPVDNGRGSWMISARRSFLDLLIGAIGSGAVPRYSDYQGKLVYDLNDQHKLMVLGVMGVDAIDMKQADAIDDAEDIFGEFNGVTSSMGVNWRALWGDKGFSQTSISNMYTRYKFDYYETISQIKQWSSRTPEQTWQFRNINQFVLGDRGRVEFGVEGKHLINDYDYYYRAYTDEFGQDRPSLTVKDRLTGNSIGGFMSLTFDPFSRLSLTIGGRGDYLDYSGNGTFSPRASALLRLTDRTSLTGSYGVHYQHLPLYILSQKREFKDLKDPVAYHSIVGLSHLLREDTRLTIEAYNKQYRNFPMDPATPSLFMLDEVQTSGWFKNHESLVDEGKAWSRGVEVMVQKKLADQLYGLVSASYSRTRYKGLDGEWRNRAYDNRWIATMEGGYKPNPKWEYSIRWIYAGGAPYTPLDLDASAALNRSVIDRNNIMGGRQQDYHSMNVRVDRRFHYGSRNMVVYFSVWNAYNRKNVSQIYWNQIEEKEDKVYQWSLLPIFGIEYEF
jgi:hypothetical protein